MVRKFSFLLMALTMVGAFIISNSVFAQTPKPTATLTRIPITDALNSPLATATPKIAGAAALTAQGAITPSTVTTGTSVPTVTLLPTATVVPSAPLTSNQAAPLVGTILANRSQTLARFFLEGATFELLAGRSQGLELPRATTVLNLFNCAGDLPDNSAGCFWDPYLIQQDGFYEVYDSAAAGSAPKLMLREAGAPPSGQVWVQNRTGQTESIVFKEDVFEIQPTSVLEFPVATGVPAILYVRSCVTIDDQSACEWAPKSLDAGVYYAMVEVDTPGSENGSMRTTIDLRPVVGEEQDDDSIEVASTTPTIVCNVVVPALNVRSGPGLQYDIIDKVRSTDGSAVMVTVTGRSIDNEWLTVAPTVADQGWINNSSSFISCSGDIVTLPVVDTPATPTPQSLVNEPTGDSGTDPVDTGNTETGDGTVVDVAPVETEEAPEAPIVGDTGEITDTTDSIAVPAGQSVLVVNNGFAHEMRFTLDQQYRVVEGPSEFDLQPGQSISIIVYPGDVPFTASSPWSGLSGNASAHVEADESLALWIRFEPEEGGNWAFRWN